MALFVGNNAVANAFVGANQVRRAYKGGSLVYQGWGPSSEREFVQMSAPGGPAQLLKVYGKTIVDAGSLQSNKTAELRAERVPVINVWDEEWESGNIDATTGENTANLTTIRATNYTPVLPNTQYYIEADNYSGQVRMRFYDANKAYIGYAGQVISSGIFTTPNDCYYMRIVLYSTTTYGNDICINLSDPAINGTYYPHWRGSLALNLSTLTGKLNGEGASVVVYPDGLRGVGNIRDEAEGSTAVQRIGSRAYQSGDESDPDVITDGTYTFYPLATPLTYTLDTPLPTDLTCEQGDKLQRVSDNNCPFVGEMKFGL